MKTAYFNNAATTYPKPDCVYDAMDRYNRGGGGSLGRSEFSTATQLAKETRKLLQDLLHCPSKKVVFTPTATEALNVILQGLPLREHAVVYISPFEHNAVTRVLHFLEEKKHIKLRILVVDPETLEFNLDSIQQQFHKEAPDLLICSHGSNVCGLVAPIEALCTLTKQFEATTVIDLCQTAGLVALDFNSNIYDFGVFAGHKTLYGPFGISGFLTSSRVGLSPLLYGGSGTDSAQVTVPETLPERFEVGTQNTLALAGLHRALQWLTEEGVTGIFQREQVHREKLLSIFRNYPFVQVIGETKAHPQIAVVSTVFEDLPSENMGLILREQGVEVRTGLHCAPMAHRFLQTAPSGTVRFSLGYFQKEEDFSILTAALEYIQDNL